MPNQYLTRSGNSTGGRTRGWFSPTPAELALVSQILLAQADFYKLDILPGDAAIKTFDGANLPRAVLGEIWNIADEDNNGWLPRKGVAIALRLMGWAQKGEKVSLELVHKPGPLPTIDGITSITQQNIGIPKSPPPILPPLSVQESFEFQALFTGAGPGPDGLLSGIKARDIFLKSNLSIGTLLKIWDLADTEKRGALDSTDFAIGMYFILWLMSGQLSSVPTTLPPGLYKQARDQLLSGQANQTLEATASGTATAPFLPLRNGYLPPWDVSHSEKADSDRYFDELDTERRAYIEGNVAVAFMLKSKLPDEDLARVWDLSDLNYDGKLTRDSFAVAMYLIKKKLAGIEIPTSLPPSLMPPSKRANFTSPSSPQRVRFGEHNREMRDGQGIAEARRVGGTQFNIWPPPMLSSKLSGNNISGGQIWNPAVSGSTSPTAPESTGLCVICQDEAATIAIIDCGHLAMCRDCSGLVMKSSRRCPLCRTSIITEARLLRIFKT